MSTEELIKENTILKAALIKVLPIVEEAFLDHHSAGCLPGSGYTHRVYRKVSDAFGWRDSKVFYDWKKSLGKLAKLDDKENG